MKLRRVLIAVAAVFGFAHSALAGTVGGPVPTFSLAIGSDVPGSTLSLSPTLTANGDGTYSASGTQEIGGAYSILFDFTLNPDPSIAGSFTLTSLSSSTQTFSVSATLGGVTVGGPSRVGGAFGEVTYRDLNDSTVGIGANPFYSARIDGNEIQPLGSFTFAPIAGGPGITLTQGAESFGDPIPNQAGPGVTSSIGVAFGFELTGMDRIALQHFEFVVVPEASELALFAICLALILCRFARERPSSR